MIEVAELVAEIERLDVPQTEAWRYAFCALAHYNGWKAARIGRYLGISRARVGQRIDRLAQWADSRDMPLLARLLDDARPPVVGQADLPVGFPIANWRDPTFALGLLEQQAHPLQVAA